MKLTRRQLAAVLAPAAAFAQAAVPRPNPTADQELQAAREHIQTNSAALAQQEVPMAAEPAFQFKV